MNRNITGKDIVIIIMICVIAVAGFIIVPNIDNIFSEDTQSRSSQLPSEILAPTQPNLTHTIARGIVSAAIDASTLPVRMSAGWYKSEFNYGTRQWMVTVWSSENASKQYLGAVYIVDDANGKLLNPPPMYNPD